MAQSADHRPVRKLCSCNAVLCAPDDTTAVDRNLFGVLLLNSPANTEADFGEYVRLYRLYRGGDGGGAAAAATTAAPTGTSPYFICADGAYAALKRYCAAQASNVEAVTASAATEEGEEDAEERSTGALDHGALMAMRLCDVLIGDMDSLSTAQLRRVAALAGAAADVRASASPTDSGPETEAAAAAAAEGPLYHEKVSTIPLALLDVIRRRRDEAVQRQRSRATAAAGAAASGQVDTPVVLPITCQMTTDFHKGVALLERLRRLEQGNVDDLTEEEQAAYYQAHQAEGETRELMTACDAQLERACEEAANQASGDADETARCRVLITDVSPSESTAAASAVQTRVLPNVAVFGALGGRVDHEIGAMVTLIRFAGLFNLLVVNNHNVLFACWPDGVTQVLMPPTWTQQTTLSKDPAVSSTAPVKAEPYMCGIVPFGVLREMETTGCLWNVVKGRANRYNGFAQTEGYRFAFDGLVSVCNVVTSRLVTVDMRPTTCITSRPPWDTAAPSVNPPTVFMLGRPKSSRKPAPPPPA